MALRRSLSESCLPGLLPLAERPLLTKGRIPCNPAIYCSPRDSSNKFSDSDSDAEASKKQQSLNRALDYNLEKFPRLSDAKKNISILQTSYAELLLQVDALKLKNAVLAKENEAQRREQRQQLRLFANVNRRSNTGTFEFSGAEIELQRALVEQRGIVHSLEKTVAELRFQASELQVENENLEEKLKNRNDVAFFVQSQLNALQNDVSGMGIRAKERDFRLDEAKYHNIQLRARVDEFSAIEKKAKTEISSLQKQLSYTLDEAAQLRSRIEHLENACQKTASAYKKLLSSMAQEKDLSTALNSELEENHKTSQNIQGALTSMKRTMELTRAAKTTAEERVKNLEALLSKKENDLSNAIIKSEETKVRMDQALSKKDQELWLLSQKLKAATDAAANLPNPAEVSVAAGPSTAHIEKKVMLQMEEKLEDMKKSHEKEHELMQMKLKSLEFQNNELNEQIGELEKLQYEPRMKILTEMEIEVKKIIDDYLVNESSIETVLLCPKCLQLYARPSTLVPCGHTFCHECIDQMREENYGRLYCIDCQEKGVGAVYSTPKDCYFNDILETVEKKFKLRKCLGEKLIQWAKNVGQLQPAS